VKRKDVEAGKVYEDNTGRQVKVFALDAGWALDNSGEWVQRKVPGRRYARGTWTVVNTNFNIRVEILDEDEQWRKNVILPRHLTRRI
jgi:hypothetical protein